MKKSNALMISYMLFLSFALIADIFLSWPGLDRIAMASTIAGCFFAFADLSGWYGSVYTPKIDAVQKSIDYLPHYAHAYATLYETQKQQLQKIITIATPYADKNNLIVELINHFTSHINQLEEMRQRAHLIEQGSPEEMNDPLNSARKTLKKYRLCEMILLIMGFALLSIANDAVKEKTGLDFQKAYGIVKSGEREGAAAYESEHDYDVYFGFNKMIAKLSELLEEISKDYTIIFIVDELDRCTPEYAVKVLERLHHLTEGQSNILTIIAIDKAQLVASVKQLFGFEQPEKYLEKFINFEIKLDNGSVSELITEKYSEYIALFDKDAFPFDDSVEECIQAIFEGIDIRTQEQLVKKATVAHTLLFAGKKDYSFMCMELLTTVMISVHKYQGLFDNTSFNASSFDKVFTLKRGDHSPEFAEFFKEKFESLYFRHGLSFSDEATVYVLPQKANLYAAIIFTWCWMHSKRAVAFQHTTGDVYSTISHNHKELLEFAEFINMMQ